ncbi:MAG TPA: zinc-binding dehydrogenase, partial [Pseudomonadales bacterium]|nr:zinc-binding dehydrogenase [Pseudomonadales bacterium]
GVDVYFENVGGAVFEAVLPHLNRRSRISVCGMISQYGNTDGRNPREVWAAAGASTFAARDVAVHDLRVGNFVADYQDQFLAEMAGWLKAGRVKYKEDLWPGLERAPEAFRAMLDGRNFSKTLVVVSDDPTRPS